MKIFLTITLVINSIVLFGQSYNKPESVDYDSASNRYFISNSNNGQILEMDCQGNLSIFTSNVGSGPQFLMALDN